MPKATRKTRLTKGVKYHVKTGSKDNCSLTLKKSWFSGKYSYVVEGCKEHKPRKFKVKSRAFDWLAKQ